MHVIQSRVVVQAKDTGQYTVGATSMLPQAFAEFHYGMQDTAGVKMMLCEPMKHPQSAVQDRLSPMEIARSMAFKFAMSSNSRETKEFSARPSTSNSLAVSTCFS